MWVVAVGCMWGGVQNEKASNQDVAWSEASTVHNAPKGVKGFPFQGKASGVVIKEPFLFLEEARSPFVRGLL